LRLRLLYLWTSLSAWLRLGLRLGPRLLCSLSWRPHLDAKVVQHLHGVERTPVSSLHHLLHGCKRVTSSSTTAALEEVLQRIRSALGAAETGKHCGGVELRSLLSTRVRVRLRLLRLCLRSCVLY